MSRRRKTLTHILALPGCEPTKMIVKEYRDHITFYMPGRATLAGFRTEKQFVALGEWSNAVTKEYRGDNRRVVWRRIKP